MPARNLSTSAWHAAGSTSNCSTTAPQIRSTDRGSSRSCQIWAPTSLRPKYSAPFRSRIATSSFRLHDTCWSDFLRIVEASSMDGIPELRPPIYTGSRGALGLVGRQPVIEGMDADDLPQVGLVQIGRGHLVHVDIFGEPMVSREAGKAVIADRLGQ